MLKCLAVKQRLSSKAQIFRQAFKFTPFNFFVCEKIRTNHVLLVDNMDLIK